MPAPLTAETPARTRARAFWISVDKTLRHHGDAVLRSVRGAAWDLRRPMARRPVFVVGCSRAGTQMVYRTLGEAEELGCMRRETHDFWAGLHPLEERGWRTHGLDEADASERDRARVSRYFYVRGGKRRFVDKNNQNGLSVSYLDALFPDAHFVYVKRYPGDNIHSLIEGWGMPERFGTWSGHLPARVAVDGGRYTRWCFFLAEGWREYLEASIEEVCAFQYRAMNQAILAARESIPSSRWTEIRYEDVLDEPVESFREAFRRLGLRFGPRLEGHCRGLLDNPYNAFSRVGKDKWRHGTYASKVQRVLPAVRSVAREMGYPI